MAVCAVAMLCHDCEESARQWGYYTAANEDEQESCPLCGSDDVSIRRLTPEPAPIICPNGPDRETGEWPCERGLDDSCLTCGWAACCPSRGPAPTKKGSG